MFPVFYLFVAGLVGMFLAYYLFAKVCCLNELPCYLSAPRERHRHVHVLHCLIQLRTAPDVGSKLSSRGALHQRVPQN
jgi:hypothetical protein